MRFVDIGLGKGSTPIIVFLWDVLVLSEHKAAIDPKCGFLRRWGTTVAHFQGLISPVLIPSAFNKPVGVNLRMILALQMVSD